MAETFCSAFLASATLRPAVATAGQGFASSAPAIEGSTTSISFRSPQSLICWNNKIGYVCRRASQRFDGCGTRPAYFLINFRHQALTLCSSVRQYNLATAAATHRVDAMKCMSHTSQHLPNTGAAHIVAQHRCRAAPPSCMLHQAAQPRQPSQRHDSKNRSIACPSLATDEAEAARTESYNKRMAEQMGWENAGEVQAWLVAQELGFGTHVASNTPSVPFAAFKCQTS